MASVLPSIPYPAARNDGYWAPITSTLDWCEENYYATRYSAEIVNSLTNLLFIYLAYRGISNCLQQNHERIFLLTFVGYLIVGSGSFAFHTTLKYPMQLVDELSMIYTTCLMFWATFEHKREQTFRTLLGFALAGLAIFITAYYHYLQDPTFHQNAYAILTAIVLLRSIWMFTKFDTPWLMIQGGGAETYIRTLPVYTYMRTFAFYEAGKGAAMAMLMFLMLAAASAIYFRIWRREENL